MIDWDLEAPGLHRFFYPRKAKLHTSAISAKDEEFEKLPGLIDLFEKLQKSIDSENLDGYQSEASARQLLIDTDTDSFIWDTEIPKVSLMKAGAFDNEYSRKINTFDWEELYNRSPWIFRIFVELLSERYDYVLIDSRTGITDTSGICSMILPEKLIVVFVPNQQSLNGISDLVKQAVGYRNESDDLRKLIIYPLPSRIESDQPSLREKWRFGRRDEGIVGYQPLFENLIKDVFSIKDCRLTTYFDKVQIQHVPFYAYGEKIAILEEREDSFSIIKSYRNFMNLLLSTSMPWKGAVENLSSVETSNDRGRQELIVGSHSTVNVYNRHYWK